MFIFCEVQKVSTISRNGLDMYLVPNAKILEEASYVTAFLQPTYHVHAGVEDLAKACKALKPAAYRRIFLEDSHLQTFLCKDCSTEKTSEPAAYDEYLSH